ncbi:hypothetical protein Anas_05440 [Armadillidium nasatum]|uniref:Uncharacterized protein n=1 Tax=Armadillidium nasatum TaxID=96803 RepID=A0A5N5T9V2_9CRUS|nr:hypothetical protein Anas_05440 [Armadillidium nasatum]
MTQDKSYVLGRENTVAHTVSLLLWKCKNKYKNVERLYKKILIKITPYLQQKYCLKDGKNLFICTVCINKISLFKKSANENLSIETDSKIDITVIATF